MMQNIIKGIFNSFKNSGESASGDAREEEEMSQNSRNQRTSRESDFVQLLPTRSTSVSSKAVIERRKESADYNDSTQSPVLRQQILHTIVLEAIMEMSKDNVPLMMHPKQTSLKITSDKKMRLRLSKDPVSEVHFKSFKYYCSRTENGQPVVIALNCYSPPQQFVLWTDPKSEWNILKKFARHSTMEEKEYKKYCELRKCLESAASSKPKPRREVELSDIFEDTAAPIEAFDSKSKTLRSEEPIFTSRLRDTKEVQPVVKRNKRRSQKDVRHGRMDSHVVFDLSNEVSDDGSDTEDIPTPPRSSSSKFAQASKSVTSQQNPFARDRVDSKYFPASKPTQSTNISPLSASLPSSRSPVTQVKKASVPSSLNFNQAHHEGPSLIEEPKRAPLIRTYGNKPFESSSNSALYRSGASSAFNQVSGSQRMMPTSSSSSSFGSSSLASLAHVLPSTTMTTTKREVVDIANEDDEEVTHVLGAKGTTSMQRDPSLRSQRDRVVLTYPPGTLDSVTITVGDMDKLSNEAFINDSLLDFYLKYLQMNHEGTATSKVHVFTSFLYSRLVDLLAKSSGVLSKQFGREPTMAESWLHAYSQLWRWTAGVSLFEKMVIVFPINSGLHWSLASCVMTLDDNPDNCRGKILTFDSMTHSSHDPEMIAKTIRRYLDHEFHFRFYLGSEPKAREVKSNKVSVNANEDEDDDFEPEVVDSSTVSRRDEMGITDLYKTKVAETFTAKKFPLQRIKVAEQKDGFNCGLHLLWNFDLLLHNIDLFGSEPDYDLLLSEENSFVQYGMTTANANDMRETIRMVVQDEIKKQNVGVKSSTSSSAGAAVAASGSFSSSAEAVPAAHQDSNENVKSSTTPSSSKMGDSGKADLTVPIESSETVIETQDDQEEEDNTVDRKKMLPGSATAAKIDEKTTKDLEMEDSTKKVDEQKENKEEKVVKSLEEKESKVNNQLRPTMRLEMEDLTANIIKEHAPDKASDMLKSRFDIKQNVSLADTEKGREHSKIKQDLLMHDVEDNKVAEISDDPSSVTLSFESQTARNKVKSSGSKRLKLSTKPEEQETAPIPLVVDEIPKAQEEKEFPLPVEDDGIA